ncbi:MAG: hypothetical protein J5I90_16940 [Caldilineales bacterium]|nr:hypothetical protein [Caldilineales bacterium]
MPDLPISPDFELPEPDDAFDNMPPWAQVGVGGAGGVPMPTGPELEPGQRRAWIVILPEQLGMRLVGLADRAAHQAEMLLRDLRVQIVSPDSKLSPPALRDFAFTAVDDVPDSAEGYAADAIAARVVELLGNLRLEADDIKLIISDVQVETPPGIPFLLWHVIDSDVHPNSVLFSTHFMDPAVWGDPMSEEARLAAIEQRLTAALVNVLGIMQGFKPCSDPECYLYRPIERVRRLDYMHGFVGAHADLLNTRLSADQEQRLYQELDAHKAVLDTLETQRVKLGDFAPAYILINTEETKKNIARIEQQLDAAGG